jgi:uncharacterized cupin superfamily protein
VPRWESAWASSASGSTSSFFRRVAGTSWPHAEKDEEEFIFVISGTPDVWPDGHLYSLRDGDFVALPAGTGITHTVINISDADVLLLVGGERGKPTNQIYYPLNPGHDTSLGERAWTNCPKRALGPHDGLPDRLRDALKTGGD